MCQHLRSVVCRLYTTKTENYFMKRYQIQLMCGIVLKQFVLLLLNYIQLWKLKLLHNQIMLIFR